MNSFKSIKMYNNINIERVNIERLSELITKHKKSYKALSMIQTTDLSIDIEIMRIPLLFGDELRKCNHRISCYQRQIKRLINIYKTLQTS